MEGHECGKQKIKRRTNGNGANQTEVPEVALSIHVSPHLSSMLHAIWQWFAVIIFVECLRRPKKGIMK